MPLSCRWRFALWFKHTEEVDNLLHLRTLEKFISHKEYVLNILSICTLVPCSNGQQFMGLLK